MTLPIEVEDLTVRFGDVTALDRVTATVAGGSICGLLGRNGAGKSTLLSTLAAFRAPTAGKVRVDGEDPYEHPRLMPEICLIREGGDYEDDDTVADVLELTALLRPHWAPELADRLVERFELPLATKYGELSRGKQAAVGVVVGLATRAPLTMFDEPHLGMDAPSRYAFYEELLADYLEHPRTVVLSTHLIDEVASLLEDVIVLHHGRVLLHEPAEELRARGTEVTGPAEAVARFTAGMTVLADRSLGPTRATAVLDALDDGRRRAAAGDGLELGPVDLQDLFVHLTSRPADPEEPT